MKKTKQMEDFLKTFKDDKIRFILFFFFLYKTEGRIFWKEWKDEIEEEEMAEAEMLS